MTDSMNFGPEWLRNLSSEGSIAGGSSGGAKYQLADYRYGREEMLALFEKGLTAPSSLASFPTLYSEQQLTPLAFLPQTEEERSWHTRPMPPGGPGRGRGTSLERGRSSRGRGGYQSYNRPGYEGPGGGGWGNGDHSDWSPRKDYSRTSSVDNWRRNRGGDEDDGWRSRSGNLEKWGRSSSWRESGDTEDRGGLLDRGSRASWHEGPRGPPQRRQWDPEDHLPEWATENPSESGGTFDASGAFHGSDDEQRDQNFSSSTSLKPSKKEPPLQKSTSAQNVSDKQHPPSSQSSSKPPTTTKQVKKDPPETHKEAEGVIQEKQELADKSNFDVERQADKDELEPEKDPPKTEKSNVEIREKSSQVPGKKAEDNLHSNNRVDEDFDRLQEDLVQKLVVDEDTPKKQNVENFGLGSGHSATHPPPNLVPPVQNSWYYQDPQGDMQGPFTSSEMAEWFKAGYFSMSLLVKRQCDDGFYHLGELVSMCGGNPFLSPKPIPPLKPDVTSNISKQLELLQRQLALSQATAMRSLSQNEFWNNLNALQQRELIAQHMLTQPQISPELRFLQQAAPNPLMHMLNQMQQTNKIPVQPLPDKPPTSLTSQLDPIQSLMQQISGIPTIPGTLQAAPVSGVGGLPTSNGLPPNLQTPGLAFPNIPLAAAAAATIPPMGIPGIPPPGGAGIPGGGITGGTHNLPPRPNPLGAVDPLSAASSENDPIKSLLRQLQNNKPQQPTPQQTMDSLWQQSNQQFSSQSKPQWQQQTESQVSMWDIQTSNVGIPSVPVAPPSTISSKSSSINDPSVLSAVASTKEKDKENEEKKYQQQQQQQQRQKELEKAKEEKARSAKEEKEKEQRERELEEQKKKEKKEAEEKKRKEEQRRQEAERKAAEEKRKKEEERLKKELEKMKKEAEEKRLKELEEKRRLKEQRKAEEEARKKAEEKRKQEEKARQEAKEREEILRRNQLEEEKKAKQENSIKVSKAAPWSQATAAVLATGTSLAEIQRLEREKKQEQLAQLQKQQQILQQEQQVSNEKNNSSMPLGWAKKPPEPAKIKSLTEIQMEEQEKLAKQAAEARLAQMKEKEANPSTFISPTPWKGSSISWAIAASQLSTSGGFWDETSTQQQQQKVPQAKPSTVSKNNANVNMNQSKQTNTKQAKSKAKKEEQQVMKLFSNNNNKQDELMEWCTKTLVKLDASVDIETFVDFLWNVESALEVKDYCKEYLGDSPSINSFATQFLEKRRHIKPKTSTQKDDMSSPAPALTPSSQHPSEFQEVKGKGKKMKKSKMTKLDKSILGFSVTAAPDRINVGARDYVEN